MKSLCFAAVLSSAALSALVHDSSLSWTTKPKYKQDCFKRDHKLTRRGSKAKRASFLGAEHKDSNPGAGIDEVVPFETVLKDGYALVRCMKDELYYHADKFHFNKHDYTYSDSNVSIVHYKAVIPKEDQEEMSPDVCFRFCRTVPNMLSFGILNGRECYCAPWWKPMASDSSNCDAVCPGDPKLMCGGKSKSSVYEMHMCANTEEDLKEQGAKMKTLFESLSEMRRSMKSAADQAQKETAEFQKLFGIMGDRTITDSFQEAKVEVGKLLQLTKAADAAMMTLDDLMVNVTDLVETESVDFTDNAVFTKAEGLLSDANAARAVGEAALAAMKKKFSLQLEMSTAEGSKLATNRSQQYYDAYYFVNPEPMGAAWAKDKSSCSGALVTEPIIRITKDECAYACDEAAESGCKAFAWYAKGGGICFLYSGVTRLTQYDMCSKALEGECAPAPSGALLQTDSKQETKETPFPWKVKSVDPNATLFADSVTGMCTAVYGCPGKAPEEVVSDCSLMADYSCRRVRNPRIEEKEDGTLAMSFSGSVPSGQRDNSCTVNPEECSGCKKYTTCAGPYLETEEVRIKKGDVASYTWTSSGATDNYEVFVGLYSRTCGLVDYQFQRGEKQDWRTFELFAPKTDDYYMKFMLGSYDGTGGGAVGADMQVKDVKQTKASVPRIFSVEAKCMVKLSEYNGLSLKPDPSGKRDHALKYATKRCLKPDGTFPTPESYDKKDEKSE
jgi:hypothetical protein